MASAYPEPNQPTQTVSPLPAPPEEEQAKLDTEQQTSEDSGVIFQAVGVIVGEVNLTADGKNTVTIGRCQYRLFYIPQKRKVFEALQKEIENTGNHTYRLVVYPRVIHFPKKEQPHRLAFQLVGFDTGKEGEQTVSRELEDLEFKFSGLWQFIPVCPTPCISVFRNFTHQRLEYIKQAEPAKKVKFMKSSHLPLLWKDAPVRPFRFNPKADQDQGHPVFVSLKAKFLPQRNVFAFVALLALPQETAPKFLKASKKDKATALQTSKKNKAAALQTSKQDNTEERSHEQPKPILKKTSPGGEAKINSEQKSLKE